MKVFSVGLALAILLFVHYGSVSAQTAIENNRANTTTETTNDTPFEKYERQLNAILRTRLTEEKKFVEQLVDLVEQEKLPRTLLDRSHKWVRKRRPHTRYPFVYFERVLRLQAKKLEITIPPFDYNAYRIRGIGVNR